MLIISHRGLWKYPEQKNSREAFLNSFNSGYGTETDIRDLNGKLVISHDIPTGGELAFTDFLDILGDKTYPVALNIKSDGLAQKIAEELSSRKHVDWFVFDMSVPDQLSHIKAGNPIFTRLSEAEPSPVWLEHAVGVWLDAFNGEWYSNDLITRLLEKGKRVCIVSPELHGRDPSSLWERLLALPRHSDLILCTDRPLDAHNIFRSVM
ncbi:hypothetical protein [Aquitalea sp. ASV11]|uniref:hypothetical protein n=1 Tax=Aquitalea sp. ASV11 TaxID=2795103 RepID=UPI0018EAEA5B|nr:hypothetical protein [Aquitalea sp. ASV11]